MKVKLIVFFLVVANTLIAQFSSNIPIIEERSPTNVKSLDMDDDGDLDLDLLAIYDSRWHHP